ncbi:Tail assembly protein I from putative prophage (Phage hk022 gp20-related protein) [Candidatus Glomeribacter gigasporarum BEG34]|uniref:Tail assembly protein I from putative prophage (Phage hk022 gp20-related protein) n=1 Tax=Candidatus Glomeribacter gigasporarum BEG34 TaxID=1070319 RepID=G2JAT3_9BURK|nr:tail assembly protein [Candidatus Glomeribacter gigasporarum]CCD29885.1 Tail assembly protein I from putative prophage (Phage hk022 gp20-related protein) [Candidatus Glomeribacter gigasporarum BEG34]
MRDIRLYGHLGRRFGHRFRLEVASPLEAVRALSVQLPGFRDYLLTHSAPGYRFFVGQRNVGQEELHTHSAGSVIKIVPVIAGAGRGFLNVVLGAVLIGLAFWNPLAMPAWLIGGMKAVGTSLALSGVSQLLFRPPPLDVKDRPENQPSYAFDGPVNTLAQGHCVPVLYGELRVGSQVIGASLSTGEIAI